jgi:hypothetical protein
MPALVATANKFPLGDQVTWDTAPLPRRASSITWSTLFGEIVNRLEGSIVFLMGVGETVKVGLDVILGVNVGLAVAVDRGVNVDVLNLELWSVILPTIDTGVDVTSVMSNCHRIVSTIETRQKMLINTIKLGRIHLFANFL